MGLFALLQFRENFFETNWSFENKKDCFFEAIFCEDFHVSCKYYSFWCFFTFRSKIFNRVVRTTLYVFKVKFWRKMCFLWKKSDFLDIFDILPKNIRTLAKKFFSKFSRKVFVMSKGSFWGKENFFGGKSLVFYLIPAFDQNYLLVWGERLNKVIRTSI